MFEELWLFRLYVAVVLNILFRSVGSMTVVAFILMRDTAWPACMRARTIAFLIT
jgi:hypothetical protein